MLSKILKHEFKATYRIFIGIYIGLAALTGLGNFVIPLLDKYENIPFMIGFGFATMILVLGYIFIIMSPYIFLSVRFYRTTATREAYLTFTIPADTKTILIGKYLNTMFWTVVTAGLWYLSLVTFDTFSGMFDQLHFDRDFFLSMLSLLLSIHVSILSIFSAISLSQLARNHRLLVSIGFLIAQYTVQQIVSVIVLIPVMLSQIQVDMSSDSLDLYGGIQPDAVDSLPTFLLSFAISIVFSVVYFFLSNYMLKKKLNLL